MSKRKEGNQYDKILKENLESIFIPLASKYLEVELKTIEDLEPKLQKTLEREADVLKIVETKKGEKFILQIEFQTQNEKDMLYRMKEYDAIIQRKYELPIRQFVVFLGKGKMNMKSELESNMVFTGFVSLDLKTIKSKELLSSQLPEEIILAVLGDFGEEKAEKIIQAIIQKLHKVSENPISLRKFIIQLQVLAQLRELDQRIIKTSNMPVSIDLRENAYFKKYVNPMFDEAYAKIAEAEVKSVEAEKQKVEAEKQKVEAEKQKVEAEKQKVEAEKQKVEAEVKSVEAEKQKVEAEKQKVEVEAKSQKLEQSKRKFILKMYQQNLSLSEIAELMDDSILYIKKVIEAGV